MMFNKSKARQSIKVEKENTNIELRKKTKNLATVKKRETLWDRLSKVKKVPSSENGMEAIRSRHSLTTKTSQRLQANRQSSLNQSAQLVRKPLSPTASSINRRSSIPKKLCPKKPNIVPEIKNRTYLHAIPVKDIMTVRSLSDESKSSSDVRACFLKRGNISNEYPIYKDDIVDETSEDSNEEYKLAPLMKSHSELGSRSNTSILNNVREFLQHKHNSMALEDIELVKDVIKSDSRCRNLGRDPKLFKDILKSQLQNILKHEFAVKKVLDCLESATSLQQSPEIESNKTMNKIVSYSGQNKETQKFEVDVIFKNVPSLDKEIEILRALGEKLEATLRSTTSHMSRRGLQLHTLIDTTKKSLLTRKEIDKSVEILLKYETYVLTVEHNVQISVQLIGIRHDVGVVHEFFMAQKTITELKLESNRPFYIPKNSKNVQLVRTTFKKLKETPDELLRHVKPKNSQVAFNVLEQDPVFFNYVLNNKTLKPSNIPYALSNNYDQFEDSELAIKQSLSEGGNVHFLEDLNNKATQNYKMPLTLSNESNNIDQTIFKPESIADGDNKLFKTPNGLFVPVIRGKQRRRIRRNVTPMPIGNYSNPKNGLFKTILVGFVQMSVFIIFIMALTYPDIRC